MPTLSLTVTAQQATRIQNAYGATSLADLKQKIINDIKNTVKDYEVSLAREQAQSAIDSAIESQNTAIQTVINDVDTNVQPT